jgi:hypothetical protein
MFLPATWRAHRELRRQVFVTSFVRGIQASLLYGHPILRQGFAAAQVVAQ